MTALFNVNVFRALAVQSYEVTTSTAATMTTFSFTSTQTGDGKLARITAGANPIRYRYDGTAPTSTVGHYIAAYGTHEVSGQINCKNLQLIAVGGNSVSTITLEG